MKKATTARTSRTTTSTLPTPPPTASCVGSTNTRNSVFPTSSCSRRTVAAAAISPNTSWSTPAFLMRAATSMCSSNTPRRHPMTSPFGSAPSTAVQIRHLSPCCPRCGYATRGAGATPMSTSTRCSLMAMPCRPPSVVVLVPTGSPVMNRAPGCSPTTRPIRNASSSSPTPARSRKMVFTVI